MRSIIAAVARFIATLGRWLAKTIYRGGNIAIEWIQEQVPAIAAAAGETLESIIAAPGRLLQRFLPSRGGPAIQPPPEGNVTAPQQQRDQATERATQAAADTDLALSVRSAARALLRDQQPSVSLPPPVAAWLQHVGEGAWLYLAAMRPDQIELVLNNHPTAQVPAFDARAWANVLPATHPVAAPVAAPRDTRASQEQVRATINSALSAGGRDRIARLISDRSDDQAPAPHRASGIRP